MKRNKRGISLIVLVITIIVMIILAAAVVIALDNSGIINKANEAVDSSNLKQVQHLASLIWADAYLDENMEKEDITADYIREQLADQGVNSDKYEIKVTDTGVSVSKMTTLGELITSAADYGKLVDYSANNVTEWQVLYEDEAKGYVFLISKNIVETSAGMPNTSVENLTDEEKALYDICRVGNWDKYELNNNYTNSQNVAALIKNYSIYANTADYGTNVVGAIGGPTIELFAAGYNAKYGENTIVPIVDLSFVGDDFMEGTHTVDGKYGYFKNSTANEGGMNLQLDDIYVIGKNYMLTSPSANDYTYGGYNVLMLYNIDGENYIANNNGSEEASIRPVVCLKSSIIATVTEDGYSIAKQ